MLVNQNKLEECFDKFVKFIASETGEIFKNFKGSKYLYEHEHYKYSVYEEARSNLATKSWIKEDIGTGKIQKKVSSAIKSRVYHNYKMVDNNLIDWRKRDRFSKKITDEKLEKTLFAFYKSNTIKGNETFNQFMNEGLSYQFIAYLFFIKDKDRYLPISQEAFDEKIFYQIGIADFKTSRNCSWENYSEFLDIVKQVQQFLKTKDKNVTLLDAHSFLWIFSYDNFLFDVDSKENEFTVSNDIIWENNEKQINDSIPEIVEALEQLGIVEKKYLEGYTEIEIDAFADVQEKEKIIKQLTEKEREIYIKARLGQGKFRTEIIEYWKTCSVTDFKNQKLLIASHIKPWRVCTVEEAIDKWNGLLLTPNLDKLFDKGFITFNDGGSIKFSSLLSIKDAKQLGVTIDMKLRNISSQHQKYLEYHRNNIFLNS